MARELLPRPVRIALGATGRGIGDEALREAVENRVVLVTGASSGVGEATARRLGHAGATVLLVARSADRLADVRDEIVAAGGTAHVHPTDMADMGQVQRLAAEVLETHGHVDVLVSCAGLSIRRWVSETYDRFHDIERTIAVNYLGPARLILALLPSMRERRSGHIVSIATWGVNAPPMRWTSYIASKAALETWLRGAAPEARADGVTTSSIHLQLVRTPMLGPFKMWRYIPGMSAEEAADMVCRSIVTRQRVVAPPLGKVMGIAQVVAQGPIERGLATLAARGERGSGMASRVDEVYGGLLTIAASRAVQPIRPDRLARAGLAVLRYGASPAGVAAAAAALHPGRTAVIDEEGALTFAELERRSRALAGALHQHFDLRSGVRVALMARNHRGFVEAVTAITRLGCDPVLLNTDYAAPQLAEVLAREGAVAAIHDAEFRELFDETGFSGVRVLADDVADAGLPTIAGLVAVGAADAPPPRGRGQAVLMTSGTTGTPKGVSGREVDLRRVALMGLGILPLLSRFKPTPRTGKPVVVAPPLFHMYGYIGLMGAFAYGSPIVIRRRFDAEAILRQIADHRAESLLFVPTMLKRIMDLDPEVRAGYDTASLRLAACGAAPLPPELATAFMDEFGDVLYNGYASTELAGGSIATPRDLRAAPGTVGRPTPGVTVKILDEEGVEQPTGTVGRIFIGSAFAFEEYTGGGRKDIIGGLMRSGDVGHFDDAGRLFIDGRDDDMILSGGENVFPQEVEELLLAHPAVADAGVTGVPDDDFGQRLAAYVVLKDGALATADELRAHVGARLARFKVPREVEFVDELPRTSTGKLRRAKLGD